MLNIYYTPSEEVGMNINACKTLLNKVELEECKNIKRKKDMLVRVGEILLKRYFLKENKYLFAKYDSKENPVIIESNLDDIMIESIRSDTLRDCNLFKDMLLLEELEKVLSAIKPKEEVLKTVWKKKILKSIFNEAIETIDDDKRLKVNMDNHQILEDIFNGTFYF